MPAFLRRQLHSGNSIQFDTVGSPGGPQCVGQCHYLTAGGHRSTHRAEEALTSRQPAHGTATAGKRRCAGQSGFCLGRKQLGTRLSGDQVPARGLLLHYSMFTAVLHLRMCWELDLLDIGMLSWSGSLLHITHALLRTSCSQPAAARRTCCVHGPTASTIMLKGLCCF
jgi:hypothetical protein